MVTFLIDGKNNILHPTKKSDMIYRWLRQGKAKVLKGGLKPGQPLLVQVFKTFMKPTKCNCEFRIGIDPGYKHIGYCIYKIDVEKQTIITLISGEVETRTSEITKNMLERKMYRQNRRHNRRKNVKRKFNSCKFRKPVWKNRAKHKFQPTHWHLINSHNNLLKWIFDRIPFEQSKLHIEYNTFDIHKVINPSIYKWQYQKGPQYGFENVKSYVRYRDNYKCQICNKNVGKEMNHVHHITHRNDGLNDRPENLILLCTKCHDAVHAGRVACPISTAKSFRDMGVLNSCMKHLFEEYENVISVQDIYGHITKTVRKKYGIEKSHANDAKVIALCDSNGFTEEFREYDWSDSNIVINFKQSRRHVRNWVQRYEDRKYYMIGNPYCDAWNRRKRSGQEKMSLKEFRKLYPKEQLNAKPGRTIYRKNNRNILFKPGDIINCSEGVDTIKGWASTQHKVVGERLGRIRQGDCEKVLNSCGMCIV